MQQTRCINCMIEITPAVRFCPECGYNQQAPQAADTLRPNIVLQGRYIVGREMGRGKAGITYIGRDTADEENVAIQEYFPEGAASRDGSRSPRVVWNAAFDRAEAEQRVEQALGLELNSVMEENALRPTEVLDAFQENETAYLVVKFAAGTRPEAMGSAFAVSAGVMEKKKAGDPAGVAEAFQGGAAVGATEAFQGGAAVGATEAFQSGNSAGATGTSRSKDPNGVTRPYGVDSAFGVTEPINSGGFSSVTRPYGGNSGNYEEDKWSLEDSREDHGDYQTGTGNSWDYQNGTVDDRSYQTGQENSWGYQNGTVDGRSYQTGQENSWNSGDETVAWNGNPSPDMGASENNSWEDPAGDAKTGKRKRKKGKAGIIIAVIAVCVLLAAIAAAAFILLRGNTAGNNSADKSAEPAETVTDVEISLAGESISMYVGDTKIISVTTKPTGMEVAWSSSDETVATVSQDGTVTAVGVGEADITAGTPSGDGTAEAVCTVTVNAPSVSLNTDSLSLYTGETAVLTATVTPSGTEVTFSSGDESIVTVDGNGTVTALQAGQATVTATITRLGNVYEATCTVTVENSLAQDAANQAYEAKEQAEAAQEKAWLAEDGASEAAEKAQEAAEDGDTLTYASATYQGETNGTSREGYGICSWEGGNSYQGEWKDDGMEGYAVFYWASGDYYAGQYSDGVRSGYGSLHYESGAVYAGEWSGGYGNGYGVFSYSSGDTYAGELLDDARSSYGVYTWSNGLVYAGEWADGSQNGYGIVYENGEILYAGWWEDGSYLGATEEDAWENVLMSDDQGSSESYDVFGSDYRNAEIVAVTFLDSLDDEPQDSWDVSAAGNGSVKAWVAEEGEGYHLYIAAEGRIIAPKDCSGLFKYYENCAAIDGLDLLDTSRVTDMSGMFYECKNVTKLDVSGFDTSRVTNMHSMFLVCSSLETLDVSGFDTSCVTNMSFMFDFCSSLTELDVSGFDTSQVTAMYDMFYHCSALTELDVSGFDTSQVTDMTGMFYDCSSLKTLDVSGFDMSQAEDMENMFKNCSSLVSLKLWLGISKADREEIYGLTGSPYLAD